jgi:HEAT repeat protein
MRQLRIFTSSTFFDLEPDRQAVREAVEHLAWEGNPICWVGMEAFGALPMSPLAASEQFAEKADIVVLLLGDRYGSKVPQQEFCFTHAEWNIIRRDRIPCLAYLKQVDTSRLGPDIRDLRKQVGDELVCGSYSEAGELARAVRDDLQRELDALPRAPQDLVLGITPPTQSAARFWGRETELAQLADALSSPAARVGVWGPPGIGKTTFCQRFFQEEQARLFDPVWLRIDELFGVDAAGQKRLQTLRWDRETLLGQIEELKAARPRAVLVFDNVQAAPLPVRWLSSRLGAVPCIFIAWDTTALPPSDTVIRLPALGAEDSVALIRHYAGHVRAPQEAVERLSNLLDNYPLLLDLCGRRLQLDPSITLRELIAELENEGTGARLRLQGPTIDREQVQVRGVLVASYCCLTPRERETLSALACVPTAGISQETMDWAIRYGKGGFHRMDRALALGLLDGRAQPDWLGHRFYLRALVANFLRTTEAYPDAAIAFEVRLRDKDVLRDTSGALVGLALRKQLEDAAAAIPWDGDWLSPLLFESRDEVRRRAIAVLRGLRNRTQVEALAEHLNDLFRVPRHAEITVEILQLLADLRPASSERCLRRLWLEPEVLDIEHGTILDGDVRVEAGKAIAAARSKSFIEFLSDEMIAADRRRRKASIQVAGAHGIAELQERVMSFLDNPGSSMRRTALLALSGYSANPVIADRVWKLLEAEEEPSVRNEAAFTLGVWRDRRALPLLLKLSNDGGDDVRATSISVLMRFPDALVANRLTEVAAGDFDLNVRQNALMALAEFGDPRAGKAALALIRSGDPKSAQIAMFAVAGIAGRGALADGDAAILRAELHNQLSRGSLPTRLVASAALLDLHDECACRLLWDDLQRQEDRVHSTFRWYPISKLAKWRPSNFHYESLRPLLNDDDPAMRQVACLVAGQTRALPLIADLHSLLEDQTRTWIGETVGHYASEALDRIAGKRPPWQPHPLSRLPALA